MEGLKAKFYSRLWGPKDGAAHREGRAFRAVELAVLFPFGGAMYAMSSLGLLITAGVAHDAGFELWYHFVGAGVKSGCYLERRV